MRFKPVKLRSEDVFVGGLAFLVFSSVLAIEVLSYSRFDALAGLALWVLCFGAPALIFVSLVYAANSPKLGFALCGAAVVAAFWVPASIGLLGGDARRVFGPVKAPDGTEVAVVQWTEHNENAVRFIHRRPGEPWKSWYIDHEALRWRFASITLEKDGKRAVIRRFLLPAGYFDLETGKFTLVSWNGQTAHGTVNDTGWSPERFLQEGRPLRVEYEVWPDGRPVEPLPFPSANENPPPPRPAGAAAGD